ncbi:MAG: protein kinase [Deltaproteobacteria bacterium]|nr:protein kinase [Deltaproteobacteria bacterium]
MRPPPPPAPDPRGGPPPDGAADAPAAAPAFIGPYSVLREVARGGMASVYEVVDPVDGGLIALKLLHQRGVALQRFHREFEALSRLDHPGIVRVFRFGHAEGQGPYLTMELLDGVPAQVWAKALGRPGAPERTRAVVGLSLRLLEALAYLHARGLVHRDLKSSNLLVLRDGAVKLLDFGTVRQVEAGGEPLSAGGEFVGTYAYAAPEQLRGEAVDARADLYAFGVLVYRLLTGRRPFEGESPQALARLHLEQAPRPASALVPGLPAELDAVLLRLLEKEAEARPASALEVARRLLPLAGPAALPGPPPPPDGLAAIGRAELLAELEGALAAGGPGAALLLQGPAGAGAGALLDELGRQLRGRGLRVWSEAFAPGEGLAALVRLARALLRAGPPPSAEVGEALALLSRPPPAEGPDGRPGAVAELLLAGLSATPGPAVLLLRDVGRADAAADAALAALRRRARRRALPIQLVGSDEQEAPPGPTAGRAWAEAGLRWLPPLSLREIGLLIAAMLGRRAPPAAVVKRVARASGGRAGFAVELVHAMLQAGTLALVGGADGAAQPRWRDLSAGRLPTPPVVEQALARRLELLEPDARRGVEALAVARGPLTARALAAAGVVPGPRAAEVVGALLDAGLCVGDPEVDGVEIGVGAWASLLRAALRPARRAQLEQQLALAVGEAPVTAEKVLLLLLGGQAAEAARAAVRWAAPLIDAGEGASALPTLEAARGAQPDAAAPAGLLRLCGEARGQVDPLDPQALRLLRDAAQSADPAERAAADLGLARVHRRRGERGAAALHRSRAEEEASRRGDLPLLLRVVAEGARAAVDEVQLDAALDALDRAAELAQLLDDGVMGAELLGRMGELRVALGSLREGEAELRRALGLAAEQGARLVEARLRLELSRALRLCGRAGEAAAELEPALRALAEAGPGALRGALLIEQVHQQVDLFRLGEARAALDARAGLELASAEPGEEAEAAIAAGRLNLAAGQAEEALSGLSVALRAAEEQGLPLPLHRLRALRAEALAAVGRVPDADRESRVACRELERLGLWSALTEACLCRARALRGHEAPARALAPAWGWLAASDARLLLLEAHVLLAEHAAGRGDPELLRGELAQASCLLDELRAAQPLPGDPRLSAHPLARRLARLHPRRGS